MAGKPRPARDLRELLSLPDAALITETEAGSILGLSSATLRNRRVDLPDRPAKPIAPAIKVGRSVRYTVGAIREYIETCRCGGSPRSVRQFLNASTRESADGM